MPQLITLALGTPPSITKCFRHQDGHRLDGWQTWLWRGCQASVHAKNDSCWNADLFCFLSENMMFVRKSDWVNQPGHYWPACSHTLLVFVLISEGQSSSFREALLINEWWTEGTQRDKTPEIFLLRLFCCLVSLNKVYFMFLLYGG